jgi:hypothetical protein
MRIVYSLLHAASLLLQLAQDAIQFALPGSRSSVVLTAENLFLRKRLALRPAVDERGEC